MSNEIVARVGAYGQEDTIAQARRSLWANPAFSAGLTCIATGFALAAATPLHTPIPSRDSGVFLYIARQLLQGQLPYRDLWDHKPPGIYFFDALGLTIGHGSVWGVWGLEFVALWGAALLSWRLLLPHFGPRAAGGTTLLWILTAALLLDKGNTTEELVVPLQFAALTLLLAGQRAWSGSRALAIGVLGALALLAKPTLIGLWLAIALVVLIDTVRSRHWQLALKFFLAAGAGVVLVVLPVASWLILAGAGREAASAIFGYNAAYSAATSADRLTSIWHGLIVTAVSGLAVLALAGWATGALRLVRLPHLGGTTARLLWTAVLDVPIEFCLAALSGRSYPHYYLPWLAPLAVLAAFLICVLLGDGPPPLCAPLRERPVAGRYVLACLLTCYALAAGVVLGWLRAPADADSRLRAAAVTYVEQHTAPDDTVLLWGAATSINVAADRDAPTRYMYQYPLYMRGYQSNALVEQFLHDLMTDRPALIIDDSRETGNEGVPPLDPARRATWRSGLASASPLPSMDEVYAFIAANYQRVGAVGDYRWPIFAYVGPH